MIHPDNLPVLTNSGYLTTVPDPCPECGGRLMCLMEEPHRKLGDCQCYDCGTIFIRYSDMTFRAGKNYEKHHNKKLKEVISDGINL